MRATLTPASALLLRLARSLRTRGAQVVRTATGGFYTADGRLFVDPAPGGQIRAQTFGADGSFRRARRFWVRGAYHSIESAILTLNGAT